MSGVVRSYLHGDRTAANKGGSLVTVLCETDFAAKTDVFLAFADRAAKMAYAASSQAVDGIVTWAAVIELFPDSETERIQVENEISERITVLPAAVHQIP